MKTYKRHLVTCALPYANGPVHIGHLAGVYIPADIYVRYLRLRKQDVLMICGSDEHGVPITIKARKEGTTPQAVVDKYHHVIKQSFADFGISFDIYSRTSNKVHHDTSSQFFKTLHEKQIFVEKETQQYYDTEVNQFLADRFIIGTCPHCGNENAYGDQCEKCGASLDPTDLINPRSTISGSQPVLRPTTHWYLPLERYEGFLREWILQSHAEDWKTNVYGACKSWIEGGLQPRAVTRDLDWGVPVPIEGNKGKVLYVWFDAPIGYISATKELTPDWEKYWKSDDTRLLHFIGKDNIVFHCIIFPVMLKTEGSFILPENVPANEFLNLENDKISTSRNWAVWLHEYLQEFPNQQDVLRYVLTANMPETKDNNFTWKDFQARNNSELAAILGNFVNRVLVLTQNYYAGAVPAPGELTDFDRQTLEQIAVSRTGIETNMDTFHFREALKELMNLARAGNKYLADTEPWSVVKTNPKRVETIMHIALQVTAALSALAEPFLPFTAAKLRTLLNIENPLWENINTSILPVGHQIPKGKPDILFPQIDDKAIEHQMEKLENSRKEREAAQVKLEPAKPNINYDDFQKLDIRAATVLAAERVPKADKLLKLTVDTGIDRRTVVSGIAQHYTPEQMVGKQVLMVINLEPKKLRGIESNGMILTAETPDGKLILVQPVTPINNGSVVK